MPRYNVQNPKTFEWRCFSSVVDDWITDWMDEKRYERWRQFQYGANRPKLSESNLMTLAEAKEAIRRRKELE